MNVLTSILLICAALLTLAWLLVAQRRFVAYAARRFVALPRLQQVVLVLAVGVMTVCAQKQRTENSEQLTDVVAEAIGSDGSRRAAENAEVETAEPQAEEESLSNHNSIIRTFDYSIIDSFPANTNVVTNLCATAIRPAETSVFLRAHWSVDATNVAASLEVYASTNLLTNAWCFVGAAVLPTDANSMTIELPYESLPFGWSPIMFFILGLDEDSDNDGLSDLYERLIAGTDSADADIDGDGLSNLDEYLNGTDPFIADTDSDGVGDGVEVSSGADPTNASDAGVSPAAGSFRELTFNINGDYAAWEMTIQGLGPDDTRMRRISMGAPNAQQNVALKMRKGNSYRLSMRWLNSDGHTDPCWYCWQAKIDGNPSAKSHQGYSTTRLPGNEVVVGNGWVAENADGLLTSHVHMHDPDEDGYGGGNVAEGLTATLYVLRDPKLIPDYNRDGKIDDVDEAVCDAGEMPFRFWINDDNDTGDVNDSVNDRPGSGSNGQDAVVNGRGDLLDFTPVLVDLSDVFPPGTPDEIKDRFSWKLKSSALNAVWASLSAANAGDFLRTDCGAAFGTGLAQEATSAAVVSLASGATLPDEFVERMTANGDRGVVLVEGRAAGAGLEVQGFLDGSSTATVVRELDIRVSSVESMYRFGSLRGAESSANFAVALPGVPANLMSDGKDLDVFFTHGFNVSEQDAHAWGAEVFKRLWQSGSNARFWMVTWAGDYNCLGSSFNGLHYQQDVYQALKTGAAFRSFVEAAQPDAAKRVVMTQSLGNMVACEALRQGLNVGKYFMFNAAVPSEAIDGTLQNADAAIRAKYVPSDWNGYDPMSWASNWHKWFAADASDTRSQLGWVDRYAAALERAGEVYNYYSTGDEVFFEAANPPWLLEGVLDSTANYAWQKQETSKGSRVLAGTAYGGWGFHAWRIAGFDYTYSATEANAMVADGSVTNNPVFNRGYEPMLVTNATPDEVMYALAKYVPAVSGAVGGRSVFSDEMSENNNLTSGKYRNGWGRSSEDGALLWKHSDMKDMAYYYVYKLYEEIIQKGALK